MPVLYAIPTNHCNLNCPHCFVNQEDEYFHPAKFLEVLNNFEGNIILFGGEPTVDLDRLRLIFTSNYVHGKSKIGSITTNLVRLNDELMMYYKMIGYVATSWNLNRFPNPSLYFTWMMHIKEVHKLGVHLIVLVTLTEDLIEQDPKLFNDIVNEWPKDAIDFIRFEYYIGEHQPGYYQRVDEWLYQLANKWDSAIRVEMFDKNYQMYFDCRDTYTLTPDGELHFYCPNGLYSKRVVPSECITCERAGICMPCCLQEGCSYPKKLRHYIETECE